MVILIRLREFSYSSIIARNLFTAPWKDEFGTYYKSIYTLLQSFKLSLFHTICMQGIYPSVRTVSLLLLRINCI